MKDGIRVMSYNIHSGVGMDGGIDYGRMARLIAEYDPDVVGVQEVAVGYPRLPGVNPLEALGTALNMKGIFGKAIDVETPDGPYEYGIGILAKGEPEFAWLLRLPNVGKCEQRVALAAKIRVRGADFLFITTHLTVEEELAELRAEQIRLITDRARESGPCPAVLTGDFNALPGSPCVKELEKNWTAPGLRDGIPTFPADDPKIKIDYIAYSPADAFSVGEYRVADERAISDHRPLFAVLGH